MQENQVLSELSSAEPLDQRHLQAVVALLQNPSVAKAADAVGLDKATLYRWIKQPAFHQALTAARAQAQAQAVANLQRGADSAATLLLSAMRDPHAPVASRVRAAEAVMQCGGKAFGHSHLERRLAKLEDSVRALQPPKP